MQGGKERLVRAAVAAAAGLAVTIIALAVSWRNFTGGKDGAERQKRTQALILQVDKAIKLYRQEYGSLPYVLGDLRVLKGFEFPERDWAPHIVFDPWDYPLVYQIYTVQDTEYQVISYGRDQQRGGIGIDCDLSNRNLNPPEAYANFGMFLIYPDRRRAIVGCFLCGVFTFMAAFFMTRPLDFKGWRPLWLALKIAATIAAATMVVSFLAMVHFMSGGH